MTTYANHLCLATTFIKHDAISREAAVTYAVIDESGVAGGLAMADACQNVFADAWAPQIDAGAVIERTTVTLGHGDDTPSVATSVVAATRGARGGDGVYPNCAVLMQKHTGFGGRQNQGRSYFPFMARQSDTTEDGKIGAGAVTTLQGRADHWLATLSAGTISMVIAHRVYDRPWTEPGRQVTAVETGHLVLTATVEAVLATQRRRMVR